MTIVVLTKNCQYLQGHKPIVYGISLMNHKIKSHNVLLTIVMHTMT